MIQRIPTGCQVIDKFLGGGIPFESIVLIYGEADSGKTTLALQCVANCVIQGFKTLFVDCDGAFPVQRLAQIASEKFKEIAELIILMKPNDFHEQTLIVNSLADYITKNFGLIVFDSLTSLYSVNIAEFPEKTFELNRELNKQLASLAQIAKTQKITVIITSQVRSAFEKAYVSIEPVATRVLKFWADIIVKMKLTEDPRIIQIFLEKSPKKVMKDQPLLCHLRIEETGIHEF